VKTATANFFCSPPSGRGKTDRRGWKEKFRGEKGRARREGKGKCRKKSQNAFGIAGHAF